MAYIDIKKQPNELDAKYICRICDNKELIGTWQDVAEIINSELGNNWDESAYRKQYQMFTKLLDAQKDELFDDDEYVKKIEEKTRELEKKKQQLYTANVEYKRGIRHEGRFEMYYKTVANNIEAMEVPEYEPLMEDIRTTKNAKDYVLAIADIHCGANFETETNIYSLDEVKRRFDVLTDETMDYIQQNHIRKMKVITLGDDIQGILRVSDLKLNETSVPEATWFVTKCISNLLKSLSRFVEIDYYQVPTSNHSQSRPLNSKASELGSEDVEYLIGHAIEDLLADNERVTVHLNFGHEYIEIPIFGFNTIALHGHRVKNIDNLLSTISFQNKTFYDYAFTAHLHAGREIVAGEGGFNDVEVLLCPAFVGGDPYAESLMKNALPSCKIFVFDEVYGHTDTHKIML